MKGCLFHYQNLLRERRLPAFAKAGFLQHASHKLVVCAVASKQNVSIYSKATRNSVSQITYRHVLAKRVLHLHDLAGQSPIQAPLSPTQPLV